MEHAYYLNYRKPPRSGKRIPMRNRMKVSRRFNSEAEALQFAKENKITLGRWANIEKCQIDSSLLADIFPRPH